MREFLLYIASLWVLTFLLHSPQIKHRHEILKSILLLEGYEINNS